MKRALYRVLFLILSLTFFEWTGCGAGTEVSNPPTSTTTKLLSSSLLDVDPQLRSLLPFRSTSRQVLSDDCARGLVQCITPTNASGQVYYAGVMVGLESGYSVGPIVGTVTDPSQITSFPTGSLLDFDLAEQLTLDGEISCCGGSPYPEDSAAIVRAIEIYFGYLDSDFTLSAEDGVDEALVGDHTVRTVFGDIDGTEMKKGDLLYKGPADSSFSWCTLEAGCVFPSRPAAPLQNEGLVAYNGTEDGLGNQTIPIFSADLPSDHPTVVLTELDVLNNSLAFTIDFDMENGAGFSADLTAIESIAEMVDAFELAAEPGSADEGFTATLDVEKTPVESTDAGTGDSGAEDSGTDEGS